MTSLPVAFADVDVLVNNAGLALGLQPAQDAVLDNWERMIETNCTGLVYMTRSLLPGMVARRRGHVVNWARSPAPIRIRAGTYTARPRRSFTSSASGYAPTCTAPASG